MLIDKTKPEHAHIPSSLDGEILVKEAKNSKGKTTGFHTIRAEHLKYLVENKTPERLAEMGYSDLIDIGNSLNVTAKAPKG